MCGRYTLATPEDELVEVFGVPPLSFDLRPRYNIAPTQDAPVVGRDSRGRKMGPLRWGLVPHWSEGPRVGAGLINARSETADEKPAFREAFRRRRCLVPADGFYEWKRVGDRKQPYWIHRSRGGPLAFAGLWECWSPPGGEPLYTFTILTTDAVPSLEPIHPRMPVILPPDTWDEWLDRKSDLARVKGFLFPRGEELLEARPVATLVNSPDNDVPECVEPVPGGREE